MSAEVRAVSAPAAATAKRATLVVVIASILGTLPIWIASYPPMSDLAQHAAQVELLRNLHDPAFSFAGLFWVNWFTPYLVGYLALYALASVFGIVIACKLLVSLVAVGLPLATTLLMREMDADVFWALLTIPGVYGFSFVWGFLNFFVAAPIGLFFLLFVIRHTRRPGWRSSIYLGAFAVLLFFCHALICLFFLATAALYVLVETRSLWRTVVTLGPVAAVVPIMAIWFFRIKTTVTAGDGFGWDLRWINSLDPNASGGRISAFFPRLLGMRPSIICFVLGALLFAIPFLSGARCTKRPAAWVPLAVCLATLLVAPASAPDAWGICHRFSIFVLPFFVLVLQRSSPIKPSWRAAMLGLLVVWLGVSSYNAVSYGGELRNFQQVLSKMEPNQRVLSFVFVRDVPQYPAPVVLHLPAWYSATKAGAVDMNFAVFPTELVRYRPSDLPPVGFGSEWNPQGFRWNEWHGSLYRYFVARAPVDFQNALFAGAPCKVTLVTHAGDWWLYEKASPCAPSDNER